MNDEKLSSVEVPIKFSEWLLAMGCPPDKVPPTEKVSEMCRGQYDMVWRSLIEHVKPKEVIKFKRHNVFYDDIRRCKKSNTFTECGSNAVVPKELSLWQEQVEIKNKVARIEAQLGQKKNELNQVLDKISSKMSHRDISRRRLQDTQRRAWLLHKLSEDLKAKKENLQETRTIAESLCHVDEDLDIQNKLERCLSVLRRQKSQPLGSVSMLQPVRVACSSIVSNCSDTVVDTEELISSLVKCRCDAIWTQLLDRRAALVASLQAANNMNVPQTSLCAESNKILSYTTALHCTLALEVMKNRAKIRQIQPQLSAAVAQLDGFLDEEQCELLVLRCEQTRAEARASALQTLREEILSQSGLFRALGDDRAVDRQGTDRQIAAFDKAIINKKAEINELLASLDANERKILNARDCLIAVFNGFHKNMPLSDSSKFRGIQVELPKEPIAALKQFYEERSERRKNKVELSLDFDVTDNSFSENIETNNPSFVDELKTYLKKFALEKNRKLVLDSGEQIWIFETLQWSVYRLQLALQKADTNCSLLCPSVSLSHCVQRLVDDVQTKRALENFVKKLSNVKKTDIAIDLKSKMEENHIIDRIKKRLNENLLSLQKTNKTLDLGFENLQLWSGNEIKRYIAAQKTVDGKTYKECEAMYLEDIRHIV